MRLLSHQRNEGAIRELAREALDLLTSGRVEELVGLYGYATAFERDLASAVRADLAQALLDASGSKLLPMTLNDLRLVYYHESEIGLRAVIDCELRSREGRSVCISFAVTETETEQFFTLEDICGELSTDS